MKRKILLPIIILVYLAPFNPIYSQATLENVAGINWHEEELAPGIFQLNYHDTLFRSRQSINALQITMTDRYEAHVAYLDSSRITLKELAKDQSSMAAINGSFFNMKRGGAVVFLQANNQIITHPNPDAPAHIRKAALALKDGNLAVIEEPAAGWLEITDKYEDIMVSGPLLLYDNKKAVIDSNKFSNTRHPRSAVCIAQNSQVFLIAVDGRHAGKAAGVTIPELQQLTERLDCKDAINLDGGGSTTLWVKDKGVINYPSDNKQFNHQGDRAIANGLVIVPVN